MKTRIFVPKEYEGTVSEFGAKYDGRMKSWYVPEDNIISIFNPFIPLTIELIPSSNWENNVRSEYKNEWPTIRTKTYKKANYKCEICGKTGNTSKGEHFVECHEIWSYDMENKIQKLERLICLCPKCHRVKHWGLALIKGEEEIVKKHIMKVNNWKEIDVKKYVNEVFIIYEERSKYDWKLDLSYLERSFFN